MLAETVAELVNIFRTEVDDKVSYAASGDVTCLWKDADILGYATEAHDNLATYGYGIHTIVPIAYLAGALTVPIPIHVLQIRQARIQGNDYWLRQNNANDARSMFGGPGTLGSFVRDYDFNEIRFVSAPSEAGTLELQCTVTLQYPLDMFDDLEFTKAEDQRLMLEYMKWRAYSKHDAEAEDLTRAKTAKDNYDRMLSDRESSQRRQRRNPGVIQMEW